MCSSNSQREIILKSSSLSRKIFTVEGIEVKRNLKVSCLSEGKAHGNCEEI